MPELPRGWPPPEQFNNLVDRCGISFAYASAAIRFIGDQEVHDPVNQLRAILDMTESQPITVGTSPYLDLDKLYLSILQRAALKNPHEEHIRRIQSIISTVVSARDKSLRVLSNLGEFLSMTQDDIRNVLYDLHTVVDVPNEDHDLVELFHLSFNVFIQDKKRCTDGRFHVDVPAHEHFMALRCMNVMRNRVDYGTKETRRVYYNTREYVSLYWLSHLRSGARHGFSGELVQVLIWLIGDEGALVDSYRAAHEDIIPFVRSLVEEHRPKESEILLAFLRDAEANERVASARENFIELRRMQRY